MPSFLRKINNKNLWLRADEPTWLPLGESVADILKDLKADRGRLSFWQVEDDRSNLDRLLAAMVGTYGRADKFDYVVIPATVLEGLAIPLVETDGATPDDLAKEWHVDASELTCLGLAKLAEAVRASGDFKRVNPGPALRLLSKSVTNGWIDLSRLSPDLQDRLTQ